LPKSSKALSDVQVRRLTHGMSKDGKPTVKRHRVGGVPGLLFTCKPSGGRSWILRAVVGGKRIDHGLGGYPEVTLRRARELAIQRRELIAHGKDPVSLERTKKAKLLEAQATEVTFRQVARSYIIKKSKEYKTPQQIRRLRQQFRDYVYPVLGSLYVKDIRRAHMIDVIEPIWESKNDVAQRVRGHIFKIIQEAIISGRRSDPNPAVWVGNLDISFPAASKVAPRKHHRAIDWRELPDFMSALREYDTPRNSHPEASCFGFMVLTVSRPSEARKADWSDIDLDGEAWTIRPDVQGHKSGREWRVPLSKEAIEIIRSQPSAKKMEGRVFSTHRGVEIPDVYLSSLPDGLDFDAVAHGFRSTFKTWCQEHSITEEVSELCLKHVDTNATRAAYARSQLFEKRREVLTLFSRFALSGTAHSNVVSIRRRGEVGV